jgi:hypothetical protein
MVVADEAIAFLSTNSGLLSPEKAALASHICASWPLNKRLSKHWADEGRRLFGFTINSLDSSQRVARELFLEAARLHRELPRHEA